MKLHEQEWHEEDGSGGGCVVDVNGELVAMVGDARHRRLIAAAPTMALALLTTVEDARRGEFVSETALEMAREALKAAGVLGEET